MGEIKYLEFNFPESIFTVSNTAGGQIDHVLSEFEEVNELLPDLARAVDAGDTSEVEEVTRLIEQEMVDAYHSLETFFRILGRERGAAYVSDLFDGVEAKNRDRGYYDTEGDDAA